MSLQITHVRPFSCRGRLRNLLADCSIVGLCCVTITWQQIFNGLLQVTAEGVLPHVTVERRHLGWQVMQRDTDSDFLIEERHVVSYCVKKSTGESVVMLPQP